MLSGEGGGEKPYNTPYLPHTHTVRQGVVAREVRDRTAQCPFSSCHIVCVDPRPPHRYE